MGRAPSRALPAGGPGVAPPGASFVPATDPRVTYSGRVARCAEGGTVCFDWPATCLRFATGARQVWLRLDGGRNHFNVVVDGRRASVLRTRAGIRDYLLASGPAQLRLFEVQKRTEPRAASCVDSVLGRGTGIVAVHGLVLDAGSSLHAIEARPRPILEFVGDSETSAFGNEGPSQPGPPGLRSVLTMHPAHQDACQSWPWIVSEALGAECHIVALSGIGLLWNSSPGCSADGTLLDVYPRLLAGRPSPDMAATPSRNLLAPWPPSAIVIYAGGNDWYTLVGRRAASGEGELAAACCAFLRQVRALRGPGAPVVVLLPSGRSMNACLGSSEEQARFAEDMEACWRRAAAEAGDAGVFLERVAPDPRIELGTSGDWGQMGHFSVQGHQKWASAVVPLLVPHLRSPEPGCGGDAAPG